MDFTRSFIFAFLLMTLLSASAQSNLGMFTTAGDIGNPLNAGTSSYNSESQEYLLTGSGYNIWFERDEFHYLYREISGDFILTGNFGFEGEGVDPHRKTGWMVRASDNEKAAHVTGTLHGDGLTVMQWRELRGAYMRDPEDEIFAQKSNFTILQLERQGNLFILRGAHPGEPLQEIGRHDMPYMSDKVLAGAFVCAHNPEVVETARLWNARIEVPVSDDYDAYEDGFIGSRLELLDVFSGRRTIIHEDSGRFEAPNWMPDGKHLLYNQDGHLWTIPVTGGTPQQLNTGDANRNNNDHGISFDGKMIAISSHRSGLNEGGSTIYVLPIEGGEPTLVTEQTPSYWHGWNPNGREVVFVARRPGTGENYHIFSADVETGEEAQLTSFVSSHVDGPEFSPDGEFIYYNGNQTGTMQLWRMKPDGSAHEQLTFDENHDWFPHISPDGNWIAYLSFPPTIDPDSHPHYKRVELKLMPAAGGAPRTIAYLFGGQGTINVPSWSPDSKRVAFVSNSSQLE